MLLRNLIYEFKMRNAFIKELTALAEKDPRIMFITADLGFGVIEDFEKRFPNQFLNAGVAEQNMTGMAAGLALSGRIVFTYSIGNFPTLRCFEQIRNDVCYHNVNVKIVTVGGGFAYGALGSTHHATEDLAVMRALPNMTVVAPGDPVEAALATRAAAERPGPCYLRLARAGDPVMHTSLPVFEIGKAIQMREGSNLTLVSTGGMLPLTMKVADMLKNRGLSARVLNMHTVKPLDEEALLRAAQETPLLVTLEEHSILGGLGGAVAEVLLESSLPKKPRFKRIGLHDTFATCIGSQDYLRDAHGLSPEAIAETIFSLV